MTSNTTTLGAWSPLPEGGKSLRIPIERTRNGMPRMAWAVLTKGESFKLPA